jgi:small basic protein
MSDEKRDSMASEEGTISSPTKAQSFWNYLSTEVEPKECTGPLASYCFMTGFTDAICFSAIFVWCGFQTGNFVQLALALARLFSVGPGGVVDRTFHIADRQALTSLLSFNAGAFLGRIGDRIGPHKRIWLVFGTFLQTLFTMAAALALWKSGQNSSADSVADDRGDPSWTRPLTYVAIAFMSAALGTQGIMGKRLNTQFTTTIVLTTVWIELMGDPGLFFRKRVVSRDHKLIYASSIFIGGFVSRAILDKIGSPGALGVATGIRLLITFSWLFVQGKKAKPQSAK